MSSRKPRPSYAGNPITAVQQRLIDHVVTIAGATLTRDAARQVLQAARVWTPIPLRELDRHLDAFPDALSAPDPHAPRSVARLAHALIAAGYASAVTAPACVVCGQAKPELGDFGEPHPDGSGRCCSACRSRLRALPCARCGVVGARVARRPEGIICRRCYRDEPDRHQPCAGCGRLTAPNGRTPDGEPLCRSCLPPIMHSCSVCGHEATTKAITTEGRVCARCYTPAPRTCGHCGELRTIYQRARGDLPDLCQRCLVRLEASCVVCGRTRRGRFGPDRRFHCVSCHPQPTRKCSRCRHRRYTRAFWPCGPVCTACHDQVLAKPGDCPKCSRVRAMTGVGPSGEPECGPCTIARHRQQQRLREQARAHAAAIQPASTPTSEHRDYVCGSCGMAGYAQTVGRCTHCALTDRVTELLSDANGAISAQLMPFAGFLLATSTPQYLWAWLHRSAGARLIAQLAASAAPIDHHALDRLPQTQEVIHLRQLLVAADVLPRRFEPLALLEPWLDRQLAGRPRSHDLLVRPFAQWIVLRRARNAHRHGRFTYGSAGNSRGRLRQALHLLDWLTSQHRTLAELTQAGLDQWLTEGAHHTRRDVAPFLAWTAARRLTPKLTVTRQRSDTPSWFLDEDQHLHLLRRCLTDTALPLTARVAGALILLYGVRATTVAALTTEHLSTGPRGAYLSLGGTPALLPPSLAELINHLAAQPHRFDTAVRQPRYLIPGQPPTRPINPASLSVLLGRHGIPARAGRNTGLLALAADLPAPVLASLIGVAPTTADGWSRWAQADWSSYLAARDANPEGSSANRKIDL